MDPPPILLNRPPRLLEEQTNAVTGPGTTRIYLTGVGPNCPWPIEYKVTAQDPDSCDDLYVAWYLDYDELANRTSPIRPQTKLSGTTDGGTPNRSASLSLTTQDLTTGTHILEALVADGPIEAGGRQITPRDRLMPCIPAPAGTTWAFPDGGTADRSYYTTYAWTIVMTAGDCPVPTGQVCL